MSITRLINLNNLEPQELKYWKVFYLMMGKEFEALVKATSEDDSYKIAAIVLQDFGIDPEDYEFVRSVQDNSISK